MFDSYHYSPRPDVHVHNKVEMKPHDAADAARLYGELEKKAWDVVSNAAIKQVGALNEVKVLHAEIGFGIRGDMTRVIFEINGQRHNIEVENDPISINRAVYSRVLEVVFAQMLDKLTYYGRERMYERIAK